jgi:hypothetical protein
MTYLEKVKAEILRDSNIRIATAKAILAEAESHKAIILELLSESTSEMVADLMVLNARFDEYSALADKEVIHTVQWQGQCSGPCKFCSHGHSGNHTFSDTDCGYCSCN